MLSFFRKRLPSKDRSNEHLQHELQDDQRKRTQSTYELNNKNKKKKKIKEISSSVDNVSEPSANIDHINKSYSDVDYFPMMPGALSQAINPQIPSTSSDVSSHCHSNRPKSTQTTNGLNYVQTKESARRVFQIPVIDCRKEQQVPSYKDLDHQKTKALREVTEQRTQEKSIK